MFAANNIYGRQLLQYNTMINAVKGNSQINKYSSSHAYLISTAPNGISKRKSSRLSRYILGLTVLVQSVTRRAQRVSRLILLEYRTKQTNTSLVIGSMKSKYKPSCHQSWKKRETL